MTLSDMRMRFESWELGIESWDLDLRFEIWELGIEILELSIDVLEDG